MFIPSLWVLLLLPLGLCLNSLFSLYQNVKIARASKLKYVMVPVHAYSQLKVLLLVRLFLNPLERWTGRPPVTSWRWLLRASWPWRLRHAPFTALGTDTFLTVAPGGIIFHTADAKVIAQVTSRVADFHKATALYRSVDLFGSNVVSSEGAAWRHHRKMTAPSFTEKNNQLVWKETLDQTQSMISLWLGGDRNSKTLHEVAGDTMRLSLHVISRAGLGQKMHWPRMSDNGDIPTEESIPEGHSMSFTFSIHFLLRKIFYVLLLPRWFIKYAPVEVLRKSYEAFVEWDKYMHEMIATKKAALQDGASEASTIDLIGQLVRGQEEEHEDRGSKSLLTLTDSEVMGNLFVMIIAGHETSANSIHFSLMLLALHPEVQRRVQQELEEVFNGRPTSKWDYEHDLPRLLNGMLGAVLSEELRLISPVINIPKLVGAVPQQISINGREVTVPARSMIRVCISAVHRNPDCWPHGPPNDPEKPCFPLDNLDNDLEEFKPERWIQKDSSSLYKPPLGAYLPFSEGQRACLGRRFAQVEILAALAVILTQYSVELAVDEWASDAEVEKMTREEKQKTWQKAEQKASWTWQNKMICIITLQLRGAHIPMRLVRKGEERFWDT